MHHLDSRPWCLFKLSSFDKTVVNRTLRKLLRRPHRHPRIVALQANPLRAQAEAWMQRPDYESLFEPEFLDLCVFISELKFIDISERPGESQHARVKQLGRSAPSHTVSYQAFHMRLPEFESDTSSDPRVLQDMARLAQVTSNNVNCSDALGLHGHPSLVPDACLGRWERSPQHADVIYHSDADTIYAHAAPDVQHYPSDGDDDSADDSSGGGGDDSDDS
eukprot:13900794-Alexandrium_andersonii.AAC.1